MLNTTLEHKSALAKLLATENLKVQYSSKYPTAFFDLERRTVHIPLIDGLDEDLLDLFTGHEVGHGHETPSEGWHKAIKENEQYSAAFKSYLNVVEDIRIERKIRDRYPGLKRPFLRAYKKLVDREFFGPFLQDNINTMAFIDRLNIHTKVGSNIYVKFDQEEQALVDEALSLETWDDVVAFANKIFNRESDKMKEQESQTTKVFVPDNDEQGEQQEVKQKDSDSNDSDADGKAGSAGGEVDQNAVKASATDEAFRNAEQKMYEDSQRKRERNLHFDPGSVRIDSYSEKDFVFCAKDLAQFLDSKLREQFQKNIDEGNQAFDHNYDSVTSTLLAKHREQNSAYINFLVKEFEMRKNAKILNRGKISKSGKLDVSRVHKYKLSSDVFQRVMSFPEGKNHGMTMYMDLSGSMNSELDAVFNQVLILAEFCKKVNIPFRVFGFSENATSLYNMLNVNNRDARDRYYRVNTEGSFRFNGEFHLKEYISSELRPQEFKTAFNNILVLKEIFNGRKNLRYSMYKNSMSLTDQLLRISIEDIGEQLSSTPLNDAIVLSIQITKSFVQKYNIENMINIFLSDGDDDHPQTLVYNTLNEHTGKVSDGWFSQKSLKSGPSIIHGHGVRHVINRPSASGWSTVNLLKFARKVTGAKYVGFFIVTYAPQIFHAMAVEIQDMQYSDDYRLLSSKLKAKFRKEGYLTSPHFGYDVQFFISSKNTIMNEYSESDDTWWKEVQRKKKDAKDLSTSAIAKGFTSQQTKKQLNRIMLVEFARAIAEAA